MIRCDRVGDVDTQKPRIVIIGTGLEHRGANKRMLSHLLIELGCDVKVVDINESSSLSGNEFNCLIMDELVEGDKKVDRKIIAMAIASNSLSNAIEACEPELNCRDDVEIDSMKPNMNFYQTKMHRRKKGGKVNFR